MSTVVPAFLWLWNIILIDDRWPWPLVFPVADPSPELCWALAELQALLQAFCMYWIVPFLWCVCYAHFTDEETNPQKGKVSSKVTQLEIGTLWFVLWFDVKSILFLPICNELAAWGPALPCKQKLIITTLMKKIMFTVLSALHKLILPTTLWGKYCYYPHFTDKETKAHRGWVCFPS